jgi:hypothetical protein
MKKLFALAALTLVSFVNAQKATYMVSGNVVYQSINNTQNGASDYTNFGFSPKVGYQFLENWTVGIETGVFSQKWKTDVSYQNKNDSFSAGGFVRYSKPLSETFSLFADFGLGYLHRKESLNTDTTNISTKYDGFYAEFEPLLFLRVKNNFGINFGLGGVSLRSLANKASNNTQNQFDFTFGQAYTVGIQKNF